MNLFLSFLVNVNMGLQQELVVCQNFQFNEKSIICPQITLFRNNTNLSRLKETYALTLKNTRIILSVICHIYLS